jgi:hypothetical protein
MIIVGVDYHPSVQQVAYVDTETGDTGERRLIHSDGEAERFLSRSATQTGQRARRDGGDRTCTTV